MWPGDKKRRLKVLGKAFEGAGIIKLVSFLLFGLCIVCGFVLLAYEPVDEWHTTSFTLSYVDVRSTSRGGTVLDIYTTDNRCFVLNYNEHEIRKHLVAGQRYTAVYSDDLFHDIIKCLEDSERQYLDLDEMAQRQTTERMWCTVLLVGGISLLLILNSVYVISFVRKEKRKPQKPTKKKR